MVTEDGLQLPVGGGPKVGDSATLIIRPEQLALATGHPDDSLGVLEVVLEQTIFQGATNKYVCQLPNGQTVSVIPHAAETDAFKQVNPGQKLHLSYRRNEPRVIV